MSTVPAQNEYADIDSYLIFTFNKAIAVTESWSADLICDEALYSIPRDSLTIEGASLTIPYHIPSYVECNITILENSILDVNKNVGSERIVFYFHSKDTIRPTVSMSLTPLDDLENASRMTDIILSLNDQTVVNPSLEIDGGIMVRGANITQMYMSNQITTVNNMVILPNAGRYSLGEQVVVDVPAGMFTDEFGNYNDGVQFSFTVTDQTVAPIAQEIVNRIVFEDGQVQIRFSSMVVVGNGSVTITCVGCNHAAIISGSDLSVNGDVLIASYTGAIVNEDYVVTVSADAVYNIYGNGNEETVMSQQVTVHSSEMPSLVTSQCVPADGATAVPATTTVSLTFDQDVIMDEMCEIVAMAQDEAVSHNVTLLPVVVSQLTLTHVFSVSNLYYFTNYEVIIPYGCFQNGYGIPTAAATLSFRTIQASAPSVLTFNLESMEDVMLDASMVFTFTQELAIADDAVVMIKPQGQPAVARSISVVSGNAFTIYNQAVADRLESHTTYTVYIPEGVVCNSDNLCMEAVTFLPFTTVTESTTRVLLQHTTPSSGATQVDANTQIVLHFTGAVRVATGAPLEHIIYEEEEPITGSVEIVGQDVMLTFPLKSGKTYTYVYDENVFTSIKGSPVHYDIGSSFSFTVADTEGPEAFSFEVSGMSTATLHFNENVVTGTGSLYVVDSADNQVAGPITVTVTEPTTTVIVYINGQTLPDDIYTFRFGAGFVKDLSGNDSPAFERIYYNDRTAPFVESSSNPTTAITPFIITFNEAVEPAECTLLLEDPQEHTFEIAVSTLVKRDNMTYELNPLTGAWDSGASYTLTIPSGCFVDMRDLPMAIAKVIVFQTPVIPALTVVGASCQPPAASIQTVSQVYQQSVEIVFDSSVQYVADKQVQLVNDAGCILTTGAVTVSGSKVSIPVMDAACLFGEVRLIAEMGAFFSTETGAQNVESTVTSSIYSFSFVSTRPTIVSATAVYSGGLQIATNSRIDVTFDRAISVSESALQSLNFINFLDSSESAVQFAERIHGEVSGAVLKVVVDEPFDHPLSSQIRSVLFRPVAPADGVVAAEGTSDVAIGSVVLDRLFSLPPVTTEVAIIDPVTGEVITGPASMRPMYRVTFDQDVTPVTETCQALILSNGEETFSIDVLKMTAVSSKVYTWYTTLEELLYPHGSFTLMVDHSCFVITETSSPATGVSGLFSFTTGDDQDSPVLMGVANDEDEIDVYSNVTLTTMSHFFVEFNEEISVVSNGHIYFLDESDGSIVTVTTYHNDSNPYRVMIDIVDAPLRSSKTYQMRAENLVVDRAGNVMQPVTTPFLITTPVGAPHAVEHAGVTILATGKVLLQFQAARDPNLISGVSDADYCHYTVVVAGAVSTTLSFDDMCISYDTEPITITRVLAVDPEETTTVFIYVQNNLVNSVAYTMTEISKDAAPVPAEPSTPVLLSIEHLNNTSSELPLTLFSLRLTNGASFGLPILGYSFLFSQDDTYQVVSVEANPFSDIYTVAVSLTDEPVLILVKATSAAGSSPYSAPLSVMDPSLATDVPSAVDPASVLYEQVYADTVELLWDAPASVEAITGYLVSVGDSVVETETTSVLLNNMPAGEILVTIVAMNSVGESAPTQVIVGMDASISASVLSISLGATFAVVKFNVTFRDSAVECALNAGHIVYGNATVLESHVATIIFSDLVPAFAYSGLCWAYSLSGSDVSSSIGLSFTTAAEAETVEITVTDLHVSSLTEASMNVEINVPAHVACMFVSDTERLVHRDVMLMGQKKEHRLDGALLYSFTSLPSAENIRLYCAAENAAGERLAPVFISDAIPVPQVHGTVHLLSTSLENGAKEVSLRPTIVLTYDQNVQLGPRGEFVVENTSTGEKVTMGSESVKVEGAVVTVNVREKLQVSGHYTYYMTSEMFLLPVNPSAVLRRIIYGEILFTTIDTETAPTVELAQESTPLPEDIDPELFSIIFSFSEVVYPFGEVPIKVTYSGIETEIPPSQWKVSDRTMGLITYDVLPTTPQSYIVSMPACTVINVNGMCNEAYSGSFTSKPDSKRPVVLSSQPTDGQEHIPNDVPLKLFFNEPVVLYNVNAIALRTNGQGQALSVHDIAIDGHVVTILQPSGYSRGNSNLESIEVSLTVQEDAFRDMSGNSNEEFQLQFVAVPQRCGSGYLSSYMQDECVCTNVNDTCVCKCGWVTLWNL